MSIATVMRRASSSILPLIQRDALCILLVLGALLVPRLSSRAAANGATPPAGDVRLGIVPLDPAIADAADLLVSAFTKQSRGLELLERTEIERLFHEQALASSSGNYIETGRILGADGLLLLSFARDGPNKFLQAKLVATKPGVVVGADRVPWPIPDLPAWAAALPKRFANLLPKLMVLRQDAVPISVLNLRSSLQTAETRDWEKSATLLLIYRLSLQRELFVLERQHINEVLFEQEMRGDGEASFWAGGYLLDGTLDPDGYDPKRVTLRARLVPPQGGPAVVLSAEGTRAAPDKLIEDLVSSVLSALKRSPTTIPAPENEANQYVEEAKWAFKWKLWPEAQAASEVAWALGNRSKELSQLRIRSYSEAVARDENDGGGAQIPEPPDPAELSSAIRSAELISSFGPAELASEDRLHCAWHELTFKILRKGTSLLDGFCQQVELIPGHELELFRLRRGLREVNAMMHTNGFEQFHFSPFDKVQEVRWMQGGTWFEKPDQATPMFIRALESGHFPERLPRFAAWSWNERKKVPGIMRGFLEQACASTNLLVRLNGLYLSLLWLPVDKDGRFETQQQELLRAIWDHRRAVMTNSIICALIPQAEEALGAKRGRDAAWVARNDIAKLKWQLCLDYLEHGSVWDERLFTFLIPHQNKFTREQAAELVPRLEGFRDRVASKTASFRKADLVVGTTLGEIQTAAGLAAGSAPKPVIRSASRPTGVFTVPFVQWKLNRSGIDSSLEPEVMTARLHEERVWVSLKFENRRWTGYEPRYSFVRIEASGGRSEEIIVPEKERAVDGHFSVTSDALYAGMFNRIGRFGFAERAWRTLPIPNLGFARLISLQPGNHLFIANDEGLFEVEQESGSLQVVASARRKPAANPLDANWNRKAEVSATARGSLLISTESELFEYTYKDRRLKTLTALPVLGRSYKTASFCSEEGIGMLCRDPEWEDCFAAYWFGPAMRCLLRGSSLAWYRPADATNTHWAWPKKYSLEGSLVTFEGRSLWSIALPQPSGTPGWDDAPQPFPDDRQATLLQFAPGRSEPVVLPLRFESCAAASDPFDRRGAGFLQGKPFFYSLPTGLLVTSRRVDGHWWIPRDRLTSLLTPEKQEPSSAAKGSKRPKDTSSRNP